MSSAVGELAGCPTTSCKPDGGCLGANNQVSRSAKGNILTSHIQKGPGCYHCHHHHHILPRRAARIGAQLGVATLNCSLDSTNGSLLSSVLSPFSSCSIATCELRDFCANMTDQVAADGTAPTLDLKAAKAALTSSSTSSRIAQLRVVDDKLSQKGRSTLAPFPACSFH